MKTTTKGYLRQVKFDLDPAYANRLDFLVSRLNPTPSRISFLRFLIDSELDRLGIDRDSLSPSRKSPRRK